MQVLLERSDNIVFLRAATLSDQVLVARALGGDAAARRTVVERFAGHVAGVLRNVIGGQVPLQDLSQEVFLVVFRDLHRLRDPSALRPWITRIAVHCAQTFLRARRRRRWLVLADDDEAPAEPPAPAGASSEDREAVRAAYQVLGTLPERERIAFVLRFVEGMQLEEIAAALDISLATAKRALRRAEDSFRARGAGPEALAPGRKGVHVSSSPNDDLHRLGDRIREHHAQQGPGVDVAALVLAVERGPRRHPARRLLPALGAASVLAAAALVFLYLSATPTLEVEVDGMRGGPGDRVVAGATERVLSFSDGSSLLTAPRSELVLREVTADGAIVRLDRGRLAVSIRHHDHTQWRFEAGPNVVEVTGTRFDLSWDPDDERLVLTMHDGSVRVHGPGLHPRTLVAGQSLRLPETASAAPAPPEDNDLPDPPTSAEPTTEASDVTSSPAEPGERPSRAPRSSRAPAGATEAAPTWDVLEERGDYEGAFRTAELEGLESLRATLPAARLVRLADAARLSGHGEQANLCYRAVRERFPSSAHAARAAFDLGLVTSGETSERWFRTYLEEAPRGELEREALGHLLEARYAVGDQEGASRWAASYIERYPNGPHATLARRVTAPR